MGTAHRVSPDASRVAAVDVRTAPRGQRTWLSPYAAVWHRQYPESAVPFKQLARVLKPLAVAHPPERIAAELAGYLQATEARFLNLAKFAATFGTWSNGHTKPVRLMCAVHPDRPSVGEVSRRSLCRDCFEAL